MHYYKLCEDEIIEKYNTIIYIAFSSLESPLEKLDFHLDICYAIYVCAGGLSESVCMSI